jgi:hypothetical protein
VIVKTSFNKVIGGFTPLKWDLPKKENHEYLNDESGKTFLFSFNLRKKYTLKENEFAICNANSMGPIFGAGSDLEIVNDADKTLNNFGSIGKSFNYKGNPDFYYGDSKFYVKDYECYEVII